MTTTEKLNLRLPEAVRKRISKEAKRLGIFQSELITLYAYESKKHMPMTDNVLHDMAKSLMVKLKRQAERT